MNKVTFYIKHFFTPNEGNNYRAKSLHTNVLVVYLLIALVLSLVFSVSQHVLGVATDITIDRLMALTNQKRVEQGLGTLVYNERLADAARRKAADMFAKNYWAHFGPNNESPWGFILAAGYRYDTAGENLAKDFCCSTEVLDAWMNSPTHKDNILRPSYRDVGFAVVNGNLTGEETTLVVQMFGSQNVENIARSIVPAAKAAETTQAQKVVKTLPSPTLPLATPTPFHTGQDIVSAKTIPKSTLVYSFAKQQTSNISFIAIIALALALICDLYYAYKLDILRLTGKNIAHLLFVGVSLVGFLIIAKGSIL